MKKTVTILLLSFLISAFGCKPKKCADFSDPQRNYKANYDKNGLVKKKQKTPKRNWGQ